MEGTVGNLATVWNGVASSLEQVLFGRSEDVGGDA